MREQLEDIRAWAHAKVQDGRDPPWTWYQYMKLIETVNAILKAMDATAAASSQLLVSKPETHLRLVGASHHEEAAQSRQSDLPPSI